MSSTPGRLSRYLQEALTFAGLAFAVVLIIALIYMFRRVDYDGLGLLGFFALMFPSQLWVLGLAAGVVAVWMWRRRWKWPFAVFGLVALLSFHMGLGPLISMTIMARRNNVEVSLLKTLMPDVTLGGIQSDKSVRYATVDGTDLMLDVWPAAHASTGRLPAIIRVHGGAWITGTRSELPAWNMWLNESGYVVFDVEYRMPPPVRWLDEVADVKCAMGWVVANAEKYRIDVNRVSVLGYSAGAHLAMLAAYTMGNPELPPSCDAAPVKVNAVVNIYGPADLKLGYYGGGSPTYVQQAMDKYVGGPPEAYPDRYRLISPVTHVNARTPPTITLLGTSDRIVSVEQADVLTARLRDAGAVYETYLLPASDHGFDANWSSLGAQFARAKVQAFLEKHNQ